MISIGTRAGRASFHRRADFAGRRLGLRAAIATAVAVLLARVGPALAEGAAVAEAQPATAPQPAAATALPAGWKAPAEIRVGITPNYPPLAFERDGRVVGVEPDLAAAVGKVLGSRLVLKPMAWEDLPDALAAHEIDAIMSGVSVTERRKRTAAFTQPYLAIGQMVLVRTDDLARLGAPGALDRTGVRVGVQRLTTGAAYAREELPKATIVEFGSADSGIEALRDKRVDAFIHDAPTVWRLTGRFDSEASRSLSGLYRPLTREELAWAVRKDEASTLGSALDAALGKLRADGTLEEVLDRWITVRKVAVGAPELVPASPAK
ncbi:MAG: transporter substrate-binding domain-containing protein [Alphaproteobacteria bacterium]